MLPLKGIEVLRSKSSDAPGIDVNGSDDGYIYIDDRCGAIILWERSIMSIQVTRRGACVRGISSFNDPGVGVFLWRDGTP